MAQELAYIHGPNDEVQSPLPGDFIQYDYNRMVLDNSTNYFPINKSEGEFRAELLLQELKTSAKSFSSDIAPIVRAATRDIHSFVPTGSLNKDQLAIVKELDTLKRSVKPALTLRNGLSGFTDDYKSQVSKAKNDINFQIPEFVLGIEISKRNGDFKGLISELISEGLLDLNLPYKYNFGGLPARDLTINSKIWTPEAYSLIKMWSLINSKTYSESNVHNLYVFNKDLSIPVVATKTVNHNAQLEAIARFASTTPESLFAINRNNLNGTLGKTPEEMIQDMKETPSISGLTPQQIETFSKLIISGIAAATALVVAIKRDRSNDANVILSQMGTEANAASTDDFNGGGSSGLNLNQLIIPGALIGTAILLSK